MAYSDFRDKMEKEYQENGDEAWSQIKGFFTDPAHWIVAGIALLLIVAGIFTVKFLGAVRAPELPSNTDAGPVSIGEEPVSEIDEPLDEIDESSTEQPLLTGARKEGQYTFLLFGTDKEGTNTDTLMVVNYDVNNQKLRLMSIPRDTMINVSWDIKKINSVYGMSGLNGLKKHIGKLIGFVPDYYVKIDLKAFVEVVNLIGGVEFDVPREMNYDDPYQDLHIHLKPGLQTLNGEQAMGLVRWRKNNNLTAGYDDTGRIQTQQAFLRAMFKQCLKIKNWSQVTGYVEIFENNVESDLTLGNMLWFASKAMNLGEDGFSTCTIPGDYYASAWSRSTHGMQSYVTLFPRQVVELVNESFNPYLANVTLSNLDIMSILADGSVTSSTGYVADSIAAMPPAMPEEETDEDEEQDETENGERTEEPDDTETDGNDRRENEPGGETDATGGDNQPDTTPGEGEGGGEDEPAPIVIPEPQPPGGEIGNGTEDTTPTENGGDD
ncbi:MAG: LytR family transcriptional regulator [Ruminococcaceae bacterium]|nr:LytR family transcriptional regulator [Oscillospiraceae bacterium]